MNAQGPGPAPPPDALPTDGARPQPQVRPAPQAAGLRVVPIVPLHPNVFRPTHPIPPR